MKMKVHLLHFIVILLMLDENSIAQSFHSLPVKKTLTTEVVKDGKTIRTVVTELDRKGRNVSVTTQKSESSKYLKEEFSYGRHKEKIEFYECREKENSKKLKKTEIITRDFLGKISQREVMYPDSTKDRTTLYKYDRFNRKIEELEERNHKLYRKRTRSYDWRGQMIRQQTFDANNECIYDKVTKEK